MPNELFQVGPLQRGQIRLLERIATTRERSFRTYGAPRLHVKLAEQGDGVGRKRMARLIRQPVLVGVSRRSKFMLTTVGRY